MNEELERGDDKLKWVDGFVLKFDIMMNLGFGTSIISNWVDGFVLPFD